jgi:hypothetical protein
MEALGFLFALTTRCNPAASTVPRLNPVFPAPESTIYSRQPYPTHSLYNACAALEYR